MKIIVVTFNLSLLLLTNNVFAQGDYFVDEMVWRMYSSCRYMDNHCKKTTYYNYYIKGDTIINNRIYKKLYTKGFGDYSWWNPQPPPQFCVGTFYYNDSIAPIGFIRDSAKLVFYLEPFAVTPEELIYDFNLQVGDSLPVSFVSTPGVIVQSIDSLLISNSYRKRYYLHFLSSSVSQYMIEGLGHERGLLEPVAADLECNYSLVCFGVNDSSYFPSPGLNCDIPLDVQNIGSNEFNVVLYPNPTSGSFRIQSNTEMTEIRIFNSLMQVLQSNYVNNVKIVDISLDEVSTGLFFISIRLLNTDLILFRRIIKTNY